MSMPGPLELVILLSIALAVFGPKKLPEVGRSLGRGLREFRTTVAGMQADVTVEPAPDAATLPEDRSRA